jgi:ABC-type Fe3+/spermidine/putrescine transport system ATPase subunit
MVAEFIGLTNFIEGKVAAADGGFITLETALGPLRCRGEASAGRATRLLAVRPEALQLSAEARGEAGLNRLRGVVRARAFLGNLMDYRVEIAPDVLLRVQGDPHAPFAVGDGVHVVFAPAATWSVPAPECPPR